MGMDAVIVSSLPVAEDVPQLTDYHLVEDEDTLVTTVVLPEPPAYAAQWERRPERPTIPLDYHHIAIDKLAGIVAKKRR